MDSDKQERRDQPEQLLPLLHTPCPNQLPALMEHGSSLPQEDPESLRADVERLQPWGYGIQLRPGIITATEHGKVALNRTIFRSHLISDTVVQLLGSRLRDSAIIDLASNHGYFALEAAHLGARKVCGYDFRAQNTAKAEFLRAYFGVENASFETRDVFDLAGTAPAAVVYNLGLFYHVTDPWRLMQLTYDLCTQFAVIDSIMHRDPNSVFHLRVNKDFSAHSEGSEVVELQPTYRAMIALMRAVGFSEIKEVVAAPTDNKVGHHLYDTRQRRCLIGFK